MILIEAVKELLFPGKCVLCGGILSRNETDLCHQCRTVTPAYHPERMLAHLDGHTAVWYYEGNVRQSLIRFKFHNRPGYAEAYGPLLAMRILQDLPAADVVTWAPVSRKRLRERGYDQAELLAKAVAKELELPVRRMLEKHRDNPAQSGIENAQARQANVRDAYRLCAGAQVQGKRILLIDDILTTGATAGECARVMREHGAVYVTLATVAGGQTQT